MPASNVNWPEQAIFVQLNDFYHIDSSSDPSRPDTRVLPRIATILKRLRDHYEPLRIWFCLPGDFLNPSCLSRFHSSKQMIDLFNHLRLKMAVFGNHEFDFDTEHFTPADLMQRLHESKFTWLVSNFLPSPSVSGLSAFMADPNRTTDALSIQISPEHTIHIVGLLYESEYAGFGTFTDPISRCKDIIGKIKNHYIDRDGSYVPARTTFVALTHQNKPDDIKLANQVPDLHLIMGGHDHEMLEKHNQNNCMIVKAKSNARTVRLNMIAWLPKRRQDGFIKEFGSFEKAYSEYIVPSVLIPLINVALTGHENVPVWVNQKDPDIAAYTSLVYGSLAPDKPGVNFHRYDRDGSVLVISLLLDTSHPGFHKLVPPAGATAEKIQRSLDASPEHRQVLLRAPCLLETGDEGCRSRSTNFGNFVADVMRGALRKRDPGRIETDVGLVNGGSFRLNRDIVQDEPITKGIICDLLFHRNDIRIYTMTGAAIRQVIERCHQVFGDHGNFLQISGLDVEIGSGPARIRVGADGKFDILDETKTYSVATNGYLATKKEAYGDIFDHCGPPQIVENSIRDAVESELLAQLPAPAFSNVARWH
jgi:2',3'-cyclic-nucleotide 2'-phosphodiesterase (5'-nucleotidase family)